MSRFNLATDVVKILIENYVKANPDTDFNGVRKALLGSADVATVSGYRSKQSWNMYLQLYSAEMKTESM